MQTGDVMALHYLRWICLAVLGVSALLPQLCLAVDFAIDLPADMGTRPSDARSDEVFVDLPEIETRKDEFAPKPRLPEMKRPRAADSAAVKVLPPPSNNRTGRGIEGYFPTPQCLVDNIRLWEMVYRDVDSNAVIFHDRDRMGRVYGVATLPSSLSARKNATELYTSYFVNKLRELANLLDTPSRWDNAHRELAKHFVGAEFNSYSIRRAAENIRLQTGLKTRFEEGVQRSLQFLPTIHRILKEQGLPPDIMILPHVESGYHPRAVSKVGAVGLWQLMPGTMKNLLGGSYVSRRTEVEAATRAAAKLLRQNYKATQSWPLALTSYNHGLYGVLRGIRATGSHDLCTVISRYESPTFKFASSNFYAQFLAARNVAMGRYVELARSGNGATVLRPLLATRDGGRW